MKNNRYKELKVFFEKIQEYCFSTFEQLYILREEISKHNNIEDEMLKFKTFFEKKIFINKELYNPKEIEGLNSKCQEFFNAYEFFNGTRISKGKFNFFEYSLSNLNHYCVIESNLSKMRKKMETAWYGILQQYGKLIIRIAKE